MLQILETQICWAKARALAELVDFGTFTAFPHQIEGIDVGKRMWL